MSQPNFLYVGPDKSGSSWLFKVLESHPQCFVPEAKDVYYFDKYFARGEQWYLDFFAPAPDSAIAVGEISHGYLFDPDAPQRIRDQFPDMKIIATLRHPVERAVSHYFYLRSSGLIDCDFRDALNIRPGIIASSLYYDAVKRYMDVFPPEQLMINYFDDLKADPREFAFSVFRFLGLDEVDCIDFGARVREARAPKSFWVSKLLKHGAMKARDLGFTNLVGKIKNSNAVNMLYSPLKSGEKEKVSDDVEHWLAEYFIEDTKKLQALLDRDISSWLPESERGAADTAELALSKGEASHG